MFAPAPARVPSPPRQRPQAPPQPRGRLVDKPLNRPSRQLASSSSRILGGSHTQPANCGIAAHGCYRVVGPARIRKRGDCLVARMLPGSRLELIDASGQAMHVQLAPTPDAPASTDACVYNTIHEDGDGVGEPDPWGAGADDMVCACTSGDDATFGSLEAEEDGAVAECILVGAHVELGGSASSVGAADVTMQPAVCHHNGHTYLSVRSLPPTAVINLGADAVVSHPVNVTPLEPSHAA